MKLILVMVLMFSGYAFAGCNRINDLGLRAQCESEVRL
ncbi:hypothetical protein J2W59_003059 [Pseudomonas fluorescens]|nr:hypothetical protein [Pseudomonas fluorescens]